MISLVPSLLAALALLAPADVASSRRTFEEANARFTEAESPAEFLAVAALYQSILDGGLRSGVVWFNQGNAFFRAGEFGRALASYRQAERHLPRDPILASNLELVRERLGAPPPERARIDHVLFWRRWLSTSEAAWGVIGCGLLAFVFGLLGLWLGGGRGARGRFARIGARVCVAGGVVFGAAYAGDYVLEERTEHGVVVVEEAVARKGNAVSFAPAFVEPLREGAEFEVVERAGEWVRVELAGGLDGWLAEEDVVTF